MGIRGLGGFLKSKVPKARRGIQWAAHRGERWGVDISCLLYRARGAGLSTTTVIASLLVRMRLAGITPIVVFDGKPPVAKTAVIEQRRTVRVAAQKEIATIQQQIDTEPQTERTRAELHTRVADLQKKAPTVSNGEKNDIKQLLYAAGVQFVTASGEADDLLAYLVRAGVTHGVVSTDMDMLARGVQTLIVPETPDVTVLTEISLSGILTALGLTYEQFVNACQLMGSDYAPAGWHGMDPRSAIASAAAGTPLSEEMAHGAAMLAGVGVTWESLLAEKQREKWAAGAPVPEAGTLGLMVMKEGWPQDWVSVLGQIA